MTCRDCENEYSDQAQACPKCGCPNPFYKADLGEKKKSNNVMVIAIIAAITIILVAVIIAVVLLNKSNSVVESSSTNIEEQAIENQSSESNIEETDLIRLQRTAYKDIDEAIDELMLNAKNEDSIVIKEIAMCHNIKENGSVEPLFIVIRFIGENSFGGNITNYFFYRVGEPSSGKCQEEAYGEFEVAKTGYGYNGFLGKDEAHEQEFDGVYYEKGASGAKLRYYYMVDMDVYEQEHLDY